MQPQGSTPGLAICQALAGLLRSTALAAWIIQGQFRGW
jgi:hypothetical protein